jgi:hypothetical protein
MNKPCEGCRAKDAELARLREAQSSQIKAHVYDAEKKVSLDIAGWEQRVDRLMKIMMKDRGIY